MEDIVSKEKKLVSRYNSTTNKWETGYWVGRRFVVVSVAEAA